jgi:hypothetical protein
MAHFWIMDQTDSPKFPFLIKISQDNQTQLELLVQSEWPAEGKNIFCLRPERHTAPFTIIATKEKFPIKRLHRRGAILSVILDRAVRKRCEFLFTEKAYKDQTGKYEQIFWRTPAYFRQRPARVKAQTKPVIKVLIDINERYPYKFPDCEKIKLTVGDYAVTSGGEYLAVVERKTFTDFLQSLNKINTLHMTMTELATYPHAAVIVEAPYHYFLDSKRIKEARMTLAKVESLIMELYTRHPLIHLVFLENRQVAEHWCGKFLESCSAHLEQDNHSLPIFDESVDERPSCNYAVPEEFITVVGNFSFAQLKLNFPEWTDHHLRRLLARLRAEGKLVCVGRGLNAFWQVVRDKELRGE